MNKYKIVFLGSSGVGKTSILFKYTHNFYISKYESTVGAAYILQKINNLHYEIWDTCGIEEKDNIASLYYLKSEIAIIVFDLSDLYSFKKAEFWIKELFINSPHTNIIIVGNKHDLLKYKHNKEYLYIIEKIRKNNLLYLEVSAKTGKNIHLIFDIVIQNIKRKKYTIQQIT